MGSIGYYSCYDHDLGSVRPPTVLSMISARLKNAIIIIVTIVWAGNFGAGVWVDGYEPDQTINAIFMAIVGGLFALGHNENRKPPTDGGGKP